MSSTEHASLVGWAGELAPGLIHTVGPAAYRSDIAASRAGVSGLAAGHPRHARSPLETKKNGRPEEGTRAVRGNERERPVTSVPWRDMTMSWAAGCHRCAEDYE